MHFEHGMPAVEIAELMKVDRNTINNDINLLYSELGKEWGKIEFEGFHARQVIRLENQRARLLTYLDRTDDAEKKLAFERLIMDIDLKLLASSTKIYYGAISFQEQLTKQMNDTLKKQKIDWRVTAPLELVKISEKTRTDLDDLRGMVRKDMAQDEDDVHQVRKGMTDDECSQE